MTWPSSPPRARSAPARLRCHHAAVREAAPNGRSSRSSGPSPRPGPCRWDPGWSWPRRSSPVRRVGIYIEDGAPLLFFDPQTRELLRTRPNPLEPGEAVHLQRQRPVGEVPRPSTEPIRVQRRASNTGVIMVAGQQVALGRGLTGQTVTVLVSETTLAVELDDGDVRVFRRTSTKPVRSIKGQRPRTTGT